MQMLALKVEVLRILRSDGPRDVDRLAAATLYSRAFIRTVVNDLVEEGSVTCDAKGVFHAA